MYDPRVATRIMRGESFSAADYIDLSGCAALADRANRPRASHPMTR